MLIEEHIFSYWLVRIPHIRNKVDWALYFLYGFVSLDSSLPIYWLTIEV